MRVYELAKELNLDSRRLLDLMRRLKIDVKNHMSTLDDQTVAQVRDVVMGKKKEPVPTVEKAPGGSPTGGAPKARPPKEERPPQPRAEAPAASRERAPTASQTQRGVSPARPPHRPSGARGIRSGGGGGGGGGGPQRHGAASHGGGARRAAERERRQTNPRRRHGGGRPKSVPQRLDRTVTIEGPSTVQTLSQWFGVPAAELIKRLMNLGIMANINEVVDVETAELLASELGLKYEVKLAEQDLEKELMADEEIDEERLRPRPPVVTVMGHVDHGKTSLLDALRKTRVTAQEAGGITQHIGAYTVTLKNKKVVFLDTPGHEAFTSMRARGAGITDIAVLVVAADDGVMPQTIEAIDHAKAAGVPVVVAINKMDKPGADPNRVMQQLAEHGLVSEEWGGETIMVPVSAKTREGLDHLLEMLHLVAEVEDLKADPDRPARGVVVESRLDRGRGPVATVLVQSGTLELGDAFVMGSTFGKVRALMDDKGKSVRRAGPSSPVEVIGLSSVGEAGDLFAVVDDEKKARQIAAQRSDRARAEDLSKDATTTLGELFQRVEEGEAQELRVVLKGDVHGSVEAVKASLERLSNSAVRLRVLHEGVGGISASDVSLASASKALILGFNVRPDTQALAAAEAASVDIRTYRVIYEAIEDIEKAMKGLLKPEFEEKVLGHAEVRQVFRVPKIGTIAGLRVVDGKVTRQSSIRVVRDGVIIHEGKVDSLKRFKDDAREVSAGMECGMGLKDFQDIKEGDHFESFVTEEVPV